MKPAYQMTMKELPFDPHPPAWSYDLFCVERRIELKDKNLCDLFLKRNVANDTIRCQNCSHSQPLKK